MQEITGGSPCFLPIYGYNWIMTKKISFLLWMLAFMLTVLLAVYQRLSGPTRPVRGKLDIDGTEIRYKLYRSWTNYKPLPVLVVAPGSGIEFRLHFRRFPFIADENWTTVAMGKQDGAFQGAVPGQPAAGKVAYKVEARGREGSSWLNHGDPVVARFKGAVPTWLLLLHVHFMFAGLLLAFRTGLEALRRDGRWQKFIPWTLGVTAVGGLIMGPLVQKYAFGAYWTGFPLGGDLTDSKTLFAVLFWLAAFFLRKKSRWWTVAATVLMVAVYLIPHSVLGSELNYKTGQVITAK
jgi:hypothetical protein